MSTFGKMTSNLHGTSKKITWRWLWPGASASRHRYVDEKKQAAHSQWPVSFVESLGQNVASGHLIHKFKMNIVLVSIYSRTGELCKIDMTRQQANENWIWLMTDNYRNWTVRIGRMFYWTCRVGWQIDIPLGLNDISRHTKCSDLQKCHC